MADPTGEPKGRYPKQEVNDGQKHGYIGDVEVYDPNFQEAGFSNAQATAEDQAPAEKPVAGVTGTTGTKSAAPKK